MTPVPDRDGPPGALAANIVFFVRALRDAGLPVGPGAALRAVEAVEAIGFGPRGDLKAALEAVLVSRREEIPVFEQAFALFWTRRGLIDKLIAMMSPMAQPKTARPPKPEAGATRAADALMRRPDREETTPSLDLDARLSLSDVEVLRGKDFAQMTADELALAEAAIARLTLPRDTRVIRRQAPDPKGRLIDARNTFRRSLRSGGHTIDLARKAPERRQPPIVALADISGSMSDYSRLFLHFLHRVSARRTVHSFLFGTRLSNVTRALRAKDIDEALAACSSAVPDWSGGTRIAETLHAFNRDWSRRVLGQGATVVLFTDGLERQQPDDLAAEMQRLRRFARRLIWVNPLLRFEGFEARASGIRAMLPHVDEFRAIHNLTSMAELCEALSRPATGEADPRLWLRRLAA